MTPLPKRKTSKGKTRRRRSHDGLTAANLVVCPACRAKRLPHTVCPNCGNYRGEEVIRVESAS